MTDGCVLSFLRSDKKFEKIDPFIDMLMEQSDKSCIKLWQQKCFASVSVVKWFVWRCECQYARIAINFSVSFSSTIVTMGFPHKAFVIFSALTLSFSTVLCGDQAS